MSLMMWLVSMTGVVWLLSVWCMGGALRGGGLGRTVRCLVGAVGFGGLGVLLGTLLIVCQAFHAFSGETLVGRVTTRRLGPEEFKLTYTSATAERAPAVEILLHGDQWAISGGIVKWHPWLTAVGLRSYHKPMRISGQFSDVTQQRSHLPTVYPLEPGADLVWEALYRADPWLPFVEAVYGSAAYIYVEPDTTQEIYVTPSGYLIKRINFASRN